MVGGISLAPLTMSIRVRIDEFKNQMKEARNIAQENSKDIKNALSKISEHSEKIATVGDMLTTSITQPLMGIAKTATSTGMDFEIQMSKIKAASGASESDLKKLEEQVFNLGGSVVECAKGMETLAKAGFNTKEIMEAMPAMLDLATCSGEELAKVSETTAKTLLDFGLGAKDTAHYSDILAKSNELTKSKVNDTGQALSSVASVAYSTGQSIEEISAAIGIMADSNIKGSEAGEILNKALVSINDPSEKVKKSLKDMGLEVLDANDKMLPLNKIIGNLKNSFSGLTEKQQKQRIATIFGQDALEGIFSLVQAGPDKLNNLTESFKNSEGAAKQLCNTLDDNTKASIEEVFDSLSNAGIKIFKVLAPYIKTFAENINKLIDKFNKLSPEAQGFIIKTGAMLVALGPLTKSVSVLSGNFSFLKTGLENTIKFFKKGNQNVSKFSKVLDKCKDSCKLMGKGTKKLIDPLNLVGRTTSGIMPIFTKLKNKSSSLVSKFSILTNRVISKLRPFSNKVQTIFSNMTGKILEKLGPFTNKFKSVFGKFGRVISRAMGGIVGNVVGSMGRCGASLLGFLGPVGVIIAIVGVLAVAIATNFGGARDAVKSVMNSIKNIISTITNVIKVIWTEWGIYIKTFIKEIWSNIEMIFKTVFSIISDVFKVFASLFKGDWEGVWNGVKDIFSSIWNMINKLLENFLNLIIMIIVGIGSKLWNAAKEAFNMILEGFLNGWDNICNWFSKASQDPVGTLLGIRDAMKEAGVSIFTSLLDGIKDVWNGIYTWITEKVDWIKEKVAFWKDSDSSMNKKEVDGSHYNGLSYVPFDGYIARLHKGERVMTAEENNKYSSSTGNNTSTVINFNGNYGFKDRMDIDYFMNQAALRLEGTR